MVSPSPELEERIKNTERLLTADARFLPQAAAQYPEQFLSPKIYDKLIQIQPWREPFPFYNKSKSKPDPDPSTLMQAGALNTAGYDRVFVLCVDFSDKPAQIPISLIYNRFFGTGKTLKTFFTENSYGKFVPEGNVFGWFRAPMPSSYYTNDTYGYGKYPNNVQKLIEDALDIAAMDESINWSYFDSNNNETIDYFFIVHAGDEASATANPDDFWALSWEIWPVVKNGYRFRKFCIGAEYIVHPLLPQKTGIDCHEAGHLFFGLPDLYDISGISSGVGNFSLMGSGSWSDIAQTPVHLDAWSKMQLGWITAAKNILGLNSIRQAETNNTDFYIYTTPTPKEYFLIENRQQAGFDEFLPAKGLLIWKVNENQRYNNNRACYLVGLVQADGKKDLELRINRGDPDDSFPGESNIRLFNSETNPNTALCDGSLADTIISDISDSSALMSFRAGERVHYSSISCTTVPEGAEIWLDGIYKKVKTPFVLDDVPVGGHILNFKRAGYQDCLLGVTVVADKIIDASCRMTPTTGCEVPVLTLLVGG